FNGPIVCSCDVARVDILNNNFSKNYLRYLFNSDFYHRYIKYFASGTLVLHLDLNGVLRYKDAIPPIDIQNRFEEVVNIIDEKIANNLKQNQELAQLRDWLLPMLMNGQVTVQEKDREGLNIAAETKNDYIVSEILDKEKEFDMWKNQV